MKKKLLLALMALLPLVGWAQVAIDISAGWKINLDPASPVNYTGLDVTPTVTLIKDGEAPIPATKFNVEWFKGEVSLGATPTIKEAVEGGYTVRVTSNITDTYGNLAAPTKEFWVLKATAQLKTAAVLQGTAPVAPATNYTIAYNGSSHNLIATAPTFDLNTNADFASITPLYSLDGTTWNEAIPSASKVGVYEVFYKVVGTDSYYGIDKTSLGKVEITGTALVENTHYTAPTALSADITFDNADHALLASGGSVAAGKGTMKYSLDGTSWGTTIPTGKNAADYTVYWKVEAPEGYYDVSGTKTAKIVAAKPAVTAAAGATGLVWNGEPKNLLSAEGTATLGATPKYQISTDNGTTYGEPLAYADVKGTAAGTYKIKTVVPGVGNYLESYALTGDDPTVVTVTIAGKKAFTSAPTAKTGLIWNKNAQQLIVEGTGTVAGKVMYSTDNTTWTADITTIKGTDAGDYNVWYKVDAENYEAVPSTQIANVKINKKVLSVKVNDVTKTYDASVALPAVSATSFTYIGRIDGDGLDVSGVTYAAVTQKNAGEYKNVLTVTGLPESNYEYTIIPGTLTINKKALTVTANQPLSAVYHTVYNISGEYTYSDFATGESAANVFATGKTPVLTTNAAAENPEPADYTIAFTEGVLVENPNYTVSYNIPAGAKFTVTPDPASKIVITVLPKTYTYGDTEDYTNLVAGTDYYVTGLIGDDVLTKAPTFSRSNASKKNADIYDLIAENAAVADPSKYPGGIIYNNSTVEIKKKEITVTVNPQTIVVGDDAAALAQLDQDAWSVTGLVYDDTKASLKGALANMLTPKAGVATAEGTYNEGIEFAFDNANYKLAAAVTGKLTVLEAGSLILDCSKNDNATKIAAQNGNAVNVSIDFSARNARQLPAGTPRTWKAEEWVVLTLPFDISVADLAQKLGYCIVNVIDPTRTEINGTSSKFYGKLTMKGGNGYKADTEFKDTKLAANKPFMVKTVNDIDGVVNFGSQVIVAPGNDEDALSVDAGCGAKFTGTYTTTEVSKTDEAKIWFMLSGFQNWAYVGKNNNGKWNIVPLEGFIDMKKATSANEIRSMTFFFEEEDGTVTAIESVNAEGTDNAASAAEGWYTINGIKLNAKPTQKGIYIFNGKKVAIQ